MIHIFVESKLLNGSSRCKNCGVKEESANDFDCVAQQTHDIQITCMPQLFRTNFLTIQEVVRELEKLLENHPKFNGISIKALY